MYILAWSEFYYVFHIQICVNQNYLLFYAAVKEMHNFLIGYL